MYVAPFFQEDTNLLFCSGVVRRAATSDEGILKNLHYARAYLKQGTIHRGKAFDGRHFHSKAIERTAIQDLAESSI